MKNLFTITIILSFIAVFAISTTQQKHNLEVIIKTPVQINPATVKKIIGEFYRFKSVIHAEALALTKSIMVIYDNDNVVQRDIKDIFEKWGYPDIEISYNLLN